MDPQTQEEQQRESGVGPIVGIIIIVTMFLIGGVYFLLMETEKAAEEAPAGEETTGQ